MNLRIGIFGYGTMGEALHKYLQKLGATVSYYHSTKPGSATLDYLITENDILFICVKPNQINDVIPNLISVNSHLFIISILAGVPQIYFEKRFPHNKVTRSMLSYSSLFLNDDKDQNQDQNQDKDQGCKADLFIMKKDNRLDPFFNQIIIQTDDQMDKIMATIGCGPAFISWIYQQYQQSLFRFCDFEEKEYFEPLLKNLFQQSLNYLMSNSPSKLIKQVACKDGATEKALKILENSELEKHLDLTFNSAYQRALILRDNFL